MESESAQLVRRALDAWNRKDVEELLSLCDPAVEFVNAPTALEPGTRRGLDEVRAVFEVQWDILGDAEQRIDRIVERGDDLITIGSFHRRMPDSDATIQAPFFLLWAVAHGKVTRLRVLDPDAVEVTDALNPDRDQG